jgi:hypothetical protein
MASKSSVFTVVVAGKSTLSKVVDNETNGVGRSTQRMARHFNEMTSKIGGSLTKVGESFEKMDIVGAGALTGLGHGLDKFAVKSTATKDIVKGALKMMGTAILSAGAGIAAFSLKAGEDYASAENALKASVEGSGGSWKRAEEQVVKVQGRYQKFGYSSAQVNSALSKSVISTGNLKASMAHLPIALDLAAAKNIDLNSAMLAVDKAASGNSRVLKQLGIDIAIPQSSALKLQQAQDKVTAAQQTMASVISNFPNAAQAGAKGHDKYVKAIQKVQIAEDKLRILHGASTAVLKTLGDRLKGQASAAADTYAGKLKAAHARATDLAKGLGEKLQPMIEKVLTWFTKFIDYANKHTWVWKTLATVIGVTLVASLLSMMAPLGSLLAGLGGLVVELGISVAGFLGFDLAAMSAAGGIAAVTAAIMATGVGALVIALIGLLVYLIFHWKQVWNVVKAVWNWIYDLIKTVVTAIWGFIDKWFVQPFMTVWDKIKDPVSKAFSWIGKAITTPFKLAMNAIKWLWNNTVGGFSMHLPSWLGGYGFTVPKIGESGASGPSGASISTDLKPVGTTAGGGLGATGVVGAPGGNQAHVVINVHGGDPNQVVAALVAHTRTNGPIPVRTSLPSAAPFTS